MATEFWFGATGQSLAAGLRRCGWDIAEVNLSAHMPQARPRSLLRIATRALSSVCEASYNSAILEATKDVEPQIFLTCKGVHVTPRTLDELGKRRVARVLHYPDVLFDHAGIYPESLARYDLIISTKSFHVSYLRERFPNVRVEHVAHGFNPEVNRPRISSISEEDYGGDVGYIGNYSSDKAEWLSALAASLPRAKLRIAGNGWEAGPVELSTRWLGKPLMGDFLARRLQSTRINIAVHWGKIGSLGWEDFVSRRSFEIPACKGFMLHIDNEEIRSLYSVGEEIDVFSTKKELVEKVAFYLARPKRRAEMIERAYARAVPAYGYHTRAREIAAEIERLL